MNLLSYDELSPYFVRLPAEALRGIVPAFLVDASCGPALRCYLVIHSGLLNHALNDVDLFYNRYFWFMRFVALHHAKYGPDAGIDQQASHVLQTSERLKADIDAAQMERVEALARSMDFSSPAR